MYFILRFPTGDCVLEYFVNSDVQRARKYYGGSCYGLIMANLPQNCVVGLSGRLGIFRGAQEGWI